jgi:tyrosyl-tRNA synthetase
MPDEIPEKALPGQDGKLGLAHLLKGAGLVSSTSEAFRMIKQGAVKIDGERVEDRNLEIETGSTHIYQVGKRKFARVTLT